MRNTFLNPPIFSFSTSLVPVIFFVYFGFGADNALRDAIYLIPMFLIIEATVKRDVNVKIQASYLFIFLLIFMISISLQGQQGNLREGIFIILSVSVLAIRFTPSMWFPHVMICASFAIIAANGGFTNINSFQILTASALAGETSFGLIVPLIALYCLQHGKRFLLTLTIISFLFTIKRISTAALIIAVALDLMQYGTWRYFVMPLTAKSLKIALLLLCLFIGFNSVWFYGELAAYLTTVTGSFVSPDALSAGRHFATGIFEYSLYAQQTPWSTLFGNGVGYSTHFLQVEASELTNKNFPLLHNDFLRVFADYGLIGVTAMVVFILSLLRGTRLMAAFGVYTMVLFLTDNVMTYFSYWVVLIFLLKLDAVQMPESAGSPNKKPLKPSDLSRMITV